MAGRALILQHERASIGSVPEWAEARGFAVEALLATDDWAAPDLEPFDFLVSMGSASASYDDAVPWLARELELLAAAQRTETPVLGICFGSQSLARSLGAVTKLAVREEIGWFEIETLVPGEIPAGPWLFWHEDSFEVPAGGELLATTPVGPAAFRHGRNLAVQFHPEATPAAMTNWLDAFRDELDPDISASLQAGMDAEPDAIVARAWDLYDHFLGAARVKAL
jgi:GMP synthase-like glutamine amidotransferase